jgi:chemotaxis protein methyltransferase CheR
MVMDKLGIVEFRNIISAIRETYGIDFSNYALTSFKRRMENFLFDNRFQYAADFIDKIKEDKNLFEKCLQDVLVKDTEMFRDPSFWSYLKTEILTKLSGNKYLRIWVTSSTTGQELFSLLIVLKELNILNNCQIVATNLSQKNIDIIKTGAFDVKKIESYYSNYDRYGSVGKLSDYYIVSNNKAYFDSSLLENVEFVKYNMFLDKAPSNFKLIIFRNLMLYYNRTLQNQVCETIYNSLDSGGYLAIGIKENIEEFATGRYLFVNKDEKIFRKI